MISFIIPVYNKGKILFKTINSLIHRLQENAITDFEIILVNDGSTDNSFAEAVRAKKFNGATDKIKIFHYSKNVGKGFALRFGFSKSVGDPVVFLDGDMDIDTRQIIQGLNFFGPNQPDMVITSKYLPESRVNYPLIRYVYSLVLKGIIRVLFNLSVSDTQVGLKMFRRQVLDAVLPKLVIKHFAFDLELLVVAHMYGFTKIQELPVFIKLDATSTIDVWAVKNFCQDIAALYYRKNILKYYDSSQTENIVPAFSVQAA